MWLGTPPSQAQSNRLGDQVTPSASCSPVEAAGPSRCPTLDFTAARISGFSWLLSSEPSAPGRKRGSPWSWRHQGALDFKGTPHLQVFSVFVGSQVVDSPYKRSKVQSGLPHLRAKVFARPWLYIYIYIFIHMTWFSQHGL